MSLPRLTSTSPPQTQPPPPSSISATTITSTLAASFSVSSSSSSSNPTHSLLTSLLSSQTTLQRRDSDSGLVNYYFVFIAVILIIAFLPIWYLLRKRTRSRTRRLATQRSALHRDLATSNASRGWTYGENRTTRLWGDGGGILALARRGRRNADEGLDERGEAPPPYKASDEGNVVVAHGREDGRRMGSGEGQEGQERGHGDIVAIPLRTIAREDIGLKPPDYSEAVAREMHDDHETGRGPSTGTTSRDEGEERREER